MPTRDTKSNIINLDDPERTIEDLIERAKEEQNEDLSVEFRKEMKIAMEYYRSKDNKSDQKSDPKTKSKYLVMQNGNPRKRRLYQCADLSRSKLVSIDNVAKEEKEKTKFVQLTELKHNTFKKMLDTNDRKLLMPTNLLRNFSTEMPKHSSTIYLRRNFFCEDDQAIPTIPYLGDNDEHYEEAMALFDEELRRRIIEFGAGYKQSRSLQIVDSMLRTIHESNNHISPELMSTLADQMQIQLSTIEERYSTLFADDDVSKSSKTSDEKERSRRLCQKPTKTSDIKPHFNSETTQELSYESLSDSFRSLFCRRCFVYDCNIHGNLDKPNCNLMAELALLKEKSGGWNENTRQNQICVEENQLQPHYLAGDSPENVSTIKAVTKGKSPEIKSVFNRSICKRACEVFDGNINLVARALSENLENLKLFCDERKYSKLVPMCHDIIGNKSLDPRHTSKKGSFRTMSTYNQSWLNKIAQTSIFPTFAPCNHEELCNDECSCVKNAFFCTKHCVWGQHSRNFFRGCSCERGKCNTNSCTCYAAKRECDPDVCKACDTCSDPPGKRASESQRCRNDNIGMGRRTRVIVAKSNIEGAGWGLFNKEALSKGDFIDEYMGELISQEEADRRGIIYDKVNRSYLFNVTTDHVIDASRKGNKARFANHSDKPNCVTKTINVNGDLRIGLFAKEDIPPQSELFFDYRYDKDIECEWFSKPATAVSWMMNGKAKAASNGST